MSSKLLRPTKEVAILGRLTIGCDGFSLLCTRYFSVELSAETRLDDQATYGMVSDGVKSRKYALVVELALNM